MASIEEAIRRLIFEYVSEGADEVIKQQEQVAASTTKTDKASLSLEKSFGSLERRYVNTVRYQQEYQKAQEKVNAAVAQNPALQDRANVLLAAAAAHYDKLAFNASKGGIASSFLSKAINTVIGPAGLLGVATTAIGAAVGYMAAQFQSASTTIEQALEEQNRLLKEAKTLIDAKASAEARAGAQAKEITLFQIQQQEEDLRKKIADQAKSMLGRVSVPTSIGMPEMGIAPEASTAAPGFEKIREAVENLKIAVENGKPGLEAFSIELAKVAAQNPALAKTAEELLKIARAGIDEKLLGQLSAAREALALIQPVSDQAARGLINVGTAYQQLVQMMDPAKLAELNAGLASIGQASVAQLMLGNQLRAESIAQTERQAIATLGIAAQYPGMTVEGAKQLHNLQAQTAAAQAMGTADQLHAQQQANITMLLGQGKTMREATAIAAAQTALAEAQINAQAELQLLTAQQNLTIAQARTAAERMVAQEQVKIAQLIAQQIGPATAVKIAATERAAAEAQVNNAVRNQIKSLEDQVRLIRARANGNEAAVKAEIAYKNAIDQGSSPELAAQLRDMTLRVERIREAEQAEQDLATEMERAQHAQVAAANQAISAQNAYNVAVDAAIRKVAQLKDYWSQIPGVLVVRSGTEVHVTGAPQFPTFTDPVTGRPSQIDPAGHTSEVLWPIGPNAGPLEDRIDTMLSKGKSLWETLGKVLKEDPMSNIASSITSLLSEDQQSAAIQARIAALMGGPRTIESETLIKTLNEQLKQLSQSTDSLNSTMQQALSPYYSQDPRTTKLGFRAGLRANPDWATGATNENPVVAVLGPGAKAPGGATLTGGAIQLPPEIRYPSSRTGFASGGSFVVPGGYSATDNKMVSFPAASGEQVVVNRKPGGGQPSVVNVDNRIVINGSVDEDTLAKLKITRFQQAQRMQSAMAAA